MSTRNKLHIYILLFLTTFFYCRVFSEDYSSEAERIASAARLSEISASSAMQVSQAHDQARTKLLVLLIKQNDEAIQILKEIKNKQTLHEQKLSKIQEEVAQKLEDIKTIQKDKSLNTLLEEIKNKKFKNFF